MFITFIQLSSSIRLDDSVTKCMSQVAAILCAGIRLTRQVLEPSFYFLHLVYHAHKFEVVLDSQEKGSKTDTSILLFRTILLSISHIILCILNC